MKRALGLLFIASVFCGSSNGHAAAGLADTSKAPLAAEFAQQVDMRLDVPQSEQLGYATRLDAALSSAGHADLGAQYIVLVDRSRMVQAVMVYWRSPEREWHFVGASPASTGRPGTFDHFVTPLGVFEHTPDNMDFRAEGTKNALGIRGYGAHGMRVYDFGWVMGERGWGGGGKSEMRLQMHATDPVLLEPQLGQTHSKGCIRIPASLDVFIDRHGLLDAEYERAASGDRHLWVLLPDRKPTAWAGKYLVVVDSERGVRPAWTRWVRERRPAASPAKRGVREATAAC